MLKGLSDTFLHRAGQARKSFVPIREWLGLPYHKTLWAATGQPGYIPHRHKGMKGELSKCRLDRVGHHKLFTHHRMLLVNQPIRRIRISFCLSKEPCDRNG